MPLAADQSWGDWVRSAVQTAAVPEADPMATQVVEVQEMSVTAVSPVGKVDSRPRCWPGRPAMAAVRTVGIGGAGAVTGGEGLAQGGGRAGDLAHGLHGGRQGVVGEGRQPRPVGGQGGRVAVQAEHHRGGRGRPDHVGCRSPRRWTRWDRPPRARLLKVVARRGHHRPLVVRGRGLADGPGQEHRSERRGAEGIAAVGRGAGHLRDVGHARPARCRSTSCPGPRTWCGSHRAAGVVAHPHAGRRAARGAGHRARAVMPEKVVEDQLDPVAAPGRRAPAVPLPVDTQIRLVVPGQVTPPSTADEDTVGDGRGDALVEGIELHGGLGGHRHGGRGGVGGAPAGVDERWRAAVAGEGGRACRRWAGTPARCRCPLAPGRRRNRSRPDTGSGCGWRCSTPRGPRRCPGRSPWRFTGTAWRRSVATFPSTSRLPLLLSCTARKPWVCRPGCG